MTWFLDLQEFIFVFYQPLLFFAAAFTIVAGLILAVIDLIRRNTTGQ